jgi:acyl-CoA synthetase (NDP forming)
MTANVIFDPALIASTVGETISSGEYDATILCVNLMWRQGDALADRLLEVNKALPTPPAVAWIAGKRAPVDKLNANGVPVFSDPVRCARAVAQALHWSCARKAADDPNDSVAAVAYPFKADSLKSHKGQQDLFDKYGIPRAQSFLTQDVKSARHAARELGLPVAAKIVAGSAAHKSEIGGVVLDISSVPDLDRACAKLESVAVEGREGILIQKMMHGNFELFAGTKRDEIFGPVVVFGLGGIYVEILKETVMRLAPFGEAEARKFMTEARFFPMLAGARGKTPANVDAVAHILSRLSILAAEQPEIETIDLNPIMVTGDYAVVVDAKVSLNH